MQRSKIQKKLQQSKDYLNDAKDTYQKALIGWKAAKKEYNIINKGGYDTREIEGTIKATNETMFYCLHKITEFEEDIKRYESQLKTG